YRSTREVVLVGADGVVFVADSQKHLLDVNLESWNELMAMIIEEERPLPIVVCLNKQDLPYAINEERLRKHLSLPLSVPVFRSVAMSGFNVIEAFQLLFQQSMRTSIMAQAIP
ncbi:MAG: hypothetical protein KAW94_03675, partial [Candidatus Thorarchaeota archaeon]|nr:hypothetical protein [Candidatus Thorarchaeota archaeon]